MANWNLMAKLMSTLGMTAFGVGICGKITQNSNAKCFGNSIFGGGFDLNQSYN